MLSKLTECFTYKVYVTNEDVSRKIQSDTGEYDELLTMVKKRKLPRVLQSQDFWLNKGDSTGHSKRKKKKRQTEEEVERQF